MLGRFFNKREHRVIKPSDFSQDTVNELRDMTNSSKYGKAIMLMHNAMVENYSNIYGVNEFEELGAFNIGILAGLVVSRHDPELAREYHDFLTRSIKIIGAHDSKYSQNGGPALVYTEGLRDFLINVVAPIIRDARGGDDEERV